MSSRNPDSGTSGSSSKPPSSPTLHSVSKESQSSSVSASRNEESPNQQKLTEKALSGETPNQENPTEKSPFDNNPNQEKPIDKTSNQETETQERESKRIKTAEAALEQGESAVVALAEESSDDESSDDESSDEECDLNQELILFPEISKGSEEYDDINLMKYILEFEENRKHFPLPISINERPPMSYQMEDLLFHIEEVWKHKNLNTSLLKNKIIKMQNKYRNILLEIGPNPGILHFDTTYGRLHFEFLKKTFD